MKYTIKIALSIMITTLLLGCGGTTDDSKDSSTSIESLLSSGVLSGTTTSTMDNENTDVKVSKENDTYKVEYPSLACKGTLEIISTSATEMIFKINFTEGSCLSGTKLKLTDIGNNQVSINEYAPSTVVTPTPDTNTNASVAYESFALNNGRFSSDYYNRPDAPSIILQSSNNGRDIIVDYPKSHCNAKWTSIKSPSLNSIRFKETITYGTCTNNRIAEIRKTDSPKKLDLTYFKPDGITKTGDNNLYYHNDQATYGVHPLSSQFETIKSHSQYGDFILNSGGFSSDYYNRPNAPSIILYSYNNGRDIIVDYPKSHCNAKWTSIKSPSLNSIRFKETITYGTCTNNRIVEIRKTDSPKKLDLTYFKPDGIAKTGDNNLYNHNDQVSTATLNAGNDTPATEQPNTQPNTSITVGNTAFISTYSGGGRFKISNGSLARYAANGTYEANIRSNINSIVPLPKGKVLVLTTAGNVEVINYLDAPFHTLYNTSTNLTSIQGGSYSNGTVYVGTQSFNVSQYTQ